MDLQPEKVQKVQVHFHNPVAYKAPPAPKKPEATDFSSWIWLAKADGAVNSCVATAPGQVKSSKTETADFSSLFD